MKTKSMRLLVACTIISLVGVVKVLAWNNLTPFATDPALFEGFCGTNGLGNAATYGEYDGTVAVSTLCWSHGWLIAGGGETRNETYVTSTFVYELQVWNQAVYNDVFSAVVNTYGNAGGRAN